MTSKPNSDEKRQFRRIVYQTDATVTNSGHSWPVKVIDLSLKGCLVECPESWHAHPGDRYQIQIPLTESVVITMNVSLAHRRSTLVGFRCIHIDLDSICQLRRLVELNLGDSHILERDLEALIQSD